jgi:hypothetical protein
MPERDFSAVQQELEDTLRNLKGTKDPEFKRPLLKKMRQLLEEAQVLADSRN